MPMSENDLGSKVLTTHFKLTQPPMGSEWTRLYDGYRDKPTLCKIHNHLRFQLSLDELTHLVLFTLVQGDPKREVEMKALAIIQTILGD